MRRFLLLCAAALTLCGQAPRYATPPNYIQYHEAKVDSSGRLVP